MSLLRIGRPGFSNVTWGILGAVEEEVWSIIDSLSQKKETRWMKKTIYQGKIGEHKVVVTASGVGKVRTAATVQYLIDHFSVDALILTGVAGAINPDLNVKDIVIGQKVVQHDFDIGGKKDIKYMKTPWFETDKELVKLAVKAGKELNLEEKMRLGAILTGDQTIIDSHMKKWLRETFQGDCVEMEGAAVGQVCCLNNIPFLLIRAITDFADENAREDFRRTRAQACMVASSLVLGMLGKLGMGKVYKRNLLFRAKKIIARNIKAIIKPR